MINENELRQNNYYLFTGLSEKEFPFRDVVGQLKLNQLLDFYVEFKNISNEMIDIFSEKGITPIPLTAKILMNSGFKCRTGSTERIKDYFIGTNPVTHDWLFSLVQIGDEPFFFKNSFHQIHYVHQLQNLWISLTGKELNVQLSEPKV